MSKISWDEKAELGRLGCSEDLTAFNDLVRKWIDFFDIQAWEIFLSVITLIESKIMSNLDFWKEIKIKLDSFHESDEFFNLSIHSRLRFNVLLKMLNTKLCKD